MDHKAAFGEKKTALAQENQIKTAVATTRQAEAVKIMQETAGLRPPLLDGGIPCYYHTVESYFCFAVIRWFFVDCDCACVRCCCCMYLSCSSMLTVIRFYLSANVHS